MSNENYLISSEKVEEQIRENVNKFRDEMMEAAIFRIEERSPGIMPEPEAVLVEMKEMCDEINKKVVGSK